MESAAKTAEQVALQPNRRETLQTPKARMSLNGGLESPQARNFAADITAIIKRSLELGNWPPLEVTKQLPRRVAIWTEFLFPRVPQARLSECFNRACDEHEGSYPVNAFEINQAWRAIRREDEAAAQQKARADAHLEQKKCGMEHTNDEDMLVEIFQAGATEGTIMPCPNCRPRAFAQKQAELMEKRKETGAP